MAESKRIPREFIDHLLERVDIVGLVNEKVPLKKAGKNHQACCPFHSEKTPSFTVSQDKQFYHCFGCGAHGNAISFLMEYEKQSFIEALKNLANREGIVLPDIKQEAVDEQRLKQFKLLQKAAIYFHQVWLKDTNSRIARAYLRDRGLSLSVCQSFQIGFAKASWDGLIKDLKITPNQYRDWIELGMLVKNDNGRVYDRFRERVMFPIRNVRGRVIGFGGRIINPEQNPKYLNSPETALFHKGKELYGLYEALQSERRPESIIVVEGYMDVIALHQFQIKNTIATLGTAVTQDHLHLLFRYTNQIILCMDGDAAGKKAVERTLEIALPIITPEKNVAILFLPENEDPDSLVRKIGLEKFKEQLKQAKSLIQVLIEQLFQQVDMTQSQGKAQLLQLAKDSLNKMNNALLKQVFIDELSHKARFEPSILNKALEVGMNQPWQVTQFNKQPIDLPPVASITRQILTLIIHQPNLTHLLPDWRVHLDIELPGIKIVRSLFSILESKPKLATGALLEYWRDTPQEHALFDIASNELKLTNEQFQEEFLSAIKKLQYIKNQQTLEQLLKKSQNVSLSSDEKHLMKNLLELK